MKHTATRLLAAHAAAQATLAIASLYALLPLSLANPSFLDALLLYPLFMLYASLPASLAADAEQACATIDRSLLSGLSDAPNHASCADACACVGQHAALLTRRYPNGTIATIEQTNDCGFSSIAAWVMIIGICNFTLSVARLAVAAAAIKFARRPRLAGLRALTTAIHSFVGISLLPMIVYTYFAADVLRLFYAASAEAQLASGASSVSCPASIESQRVGVLLAMWGCWAAGLLLHLHFGRVVYLVKRDVKRKKAEVRRVALEATGTEPAARADEELEEGWESIATCRAKDGASQKGNGSPAEHSPRVGAELSPREGFATVEQPPRTPGSAGSSSSALERARSARRKAASQTLSPSASGPAVGRRGGPGEPSTAQSSLAGATELENCAAACERGRLPSEPARPAAFSGAESKDAALESEESFV